MAILLVRHGETEGNALRILQRADIPLSAVGMQQAERLAERLASVGAAHLLCSDLLRARMTAAPVAERLGLAIETSPLLQERNFGDLRGTPYAALDYDPFGPDVVPPGGESWETFHGRVAEAFALISERAQRTQGNLVVVTHGLVCRALVGRHVPLVPEMPLPSHFANAGLTILASEPPHRAQLVDCAAHLTPSEEKRASEGGIA